MGEGWKLTWYQGDEDEDPPAKAFLEDKDLRKDERTKLIERIRLLAEHGVGAVMDLPMVFPSLKGNRYRKIHEIRVTGTPSNPRVFFFFGEQREIVLLFGVRKVGRSSKSMKRHYERAARLRDGWLKRRETL